MENATSFEELRGAWMLAHVSYDRHKGNVFFAYPQFVLSRSGAKKVPINLLPDSGAMVIAPVGRKPGYSGASYDCESVKEAFGEIVAMRINGKGPMINDRYQPDSTFNTACCYFGRFDPSMETGASEVEFQKVPTAPFVSGLYQVVELDDDNLDFSKPFEKPAALMHRGEKIVADQVVVEQLEGASLVYYGPFNWQQGPEGTLRLQGVEKMGRYIYRVGASAATEVLRLTNLADGILAARFIESRAFGSGKAGVQKIDWVSDAELLDKAASALKAAKVLRGVDFKTALSQCRLDGIYAARKDRIKNLLCNPGSWDILGDALTSAMMNPDMAAHVVDLAASDRFFPVFKDKLLDTERVKRERQAALAQIERDLDEKRASLARIQADVSAAEERSQSLEQEYEEIKAAALADARAELSEVEAQIGRGREELDRLTADVDRAKAMQEGVSSNLERMLADRDVLVADLLKDTVVRAAMTEASGTRRAKDGMESSGVIDVQVAVSPDADALADREVARSIQANLSDRAGRDLSLLEVANLMICTVQGPLTVLSGLPGTGKTSLVRALAGSLGLVGAGKRRFVEVGVERGWTSHRDWTGYYNPVSSRYEKSDPMVFDALVDLDRETDDDCASAPFLFLLDEMNLSPAEYYWGPFLRAYDTFNSQGGWVDMGGRRSLHVPARTRFLATVNFDHTTETLSPRLLDRSWVLRLNPEEVDLDGEIAPVAPDFENIPAFSWDRLVRAFGTASRAPQLEASVRDSFKRMLAILAEHGMPLSVRSQNMVRSYLDAASRFVDMADPADRLSVLDLAVAQKVLPQIAGAASPAMEGMVEALRAECAALPACSRILKRMSETGAEDGFYTYFA